MKGFLDTESETKTPWVIGGTDEVTTYLFICLPVCLSTHLPMVV